MGRQMSLWGRCGLRWRLPAWGRQQCRQALPLRPPLASGSKGAGPPAMTSHSQPHQPTLVKEMPCRPSKLNSSGMTSPAHRTRTDRRQAGRQAVATSGRGARRQHRGGSAWLQHCHSRRRWPQGRSGPQRSKQGAAPCARAARTAGDLAIALRHAVQDAPPAVRLPAARQARALALAAHRQHRSQAQLRQARIGRPAWRRGRAAAAGVAAARVAAPARPHAVLLRCVLDVHFLAQAVPLQQAQQVLHPCCIHISQHSGLRICWGSVDEARGRGV